LEVNESKKKIFKREKWIFKVGVLISFMQFAVVVIAKNSQIKDILDLCAS